MYDDGDGPEQVISGYSEMEMSEPLLVRTRANYSGLVTMCDAWFGRFYDAMQRLGRLEDTVLIVTSDHGHSIGDSRYVGKRGYPSAPEVYDVPILIRHPDGVGAGKRSDLYVQHTDLAAQVLGFAGVEAPEGADSRPFFAAATEGGPAVRDHVTVAWGPNMTVIQGNWWLNCKIDGTGVLLWDLNDRPFEHNVADANRDRVRAMFQMALDDAGGPIPPFLTELAASQQDAPGCSALAARE
jgi:arylsulfatase A-like enzyme